MLGLGNSLSTSATVMWENAYSLDFDGTDDYVNCGDDASLRPTAAISANIWFKMDDFEGTAIMRLIGNWSDSGFFIRWENKRLYGWVRVGGVSQKVFTAYDKFKSGQHYHRANGWHMATLTFDGEFVKLYINGALEDSGGTPTVDLGSTGNAIDQSSTDLTLGRHTSSNSQFYSGLLDDASVFGKTLTPTEISNFWNDGSPTDLSGESNLLGYWRMGDGATYPTIPDESSNSNDGTMTNMVSGDIVTDTP